MKLKFKFEKMELGDEIVVVPFESSVANKCILKVNEITLEILNLLQEETDREKICLYFENKYEGSKSDIETSVDYILKELDKAGLIE